jgi:hypothetical protein
MEKIDYKKELEKINEFYNKTYTNIYPFICKNRVTILKSGMYKKMNGEYYGLSAIYNQYENKHTAVLINYIYVPDDILIVPNNIEMTDKKCQLIQNYVDKGFKIKERAPAFPMFSFDNDTHEYNIAINNLKNFNYDTLNN